MNILKILVLPIPFTYIMFSSLHKCLIVFRVKVFPHLVKFIPRYFILFDTIVNGVVFFNSLFESSLLIYRKETFLYINVISCNFIELFVSSNHFWQRLQGFLILSIMSSANSDRFTTSLPIWMSFFSLVCLLWLGLPILC